MQFHHYPEQFEKIKNFIHQSQNILIVPHVDPDPDALGSSYSLALALIKINKNLQIGLNEDLNSKYKKLYPKSFLFTKNIKNPDLIFILDVGSCKRMGKYLDLLNQKIPSINFDHHPDNENFADINIVDVNSSSTCELIYSFLKSIQTPFDPEIAQSIYSGIVFDTGSFRYGNKLQNSHQIVSEILKFNINPSLIYETLFENLTLQALCLRAKVITHLELFCERKVAVIYLQNQFFQECGAKTSDTDGIVNLGLSIQGVEFSVYIYEKDQGGIKVSLRSKKNDIKVNQFAHKYGGGGHSKAAAFTLDQFDPDFKNYFIDSITHWYSSQKQ